MDSSPPPLPEPTSKPNETTPILSSPTKPADEQVSVDITDYNTATSDDAPKARKYSLGKALYAVRKQQQASVATGSARPTVESPEPIVVDDDYVPPSPHKSHHYPHMPASPTKSGTTPRGMSASDRWAAAGKKVVNVNRIGSAGRLFNEPGVNMRSPPEHLLKIRGHCTITVWQYDEHRCSTEVLTNDDLPKFLETPRPSYSKVRWINIQGMDFEVIRALAHTYDLHPLAIEDVFHTPQRIKTDQYENSLFVSMLVFTLLQQGDRKSLDHANQFETRLFTNRPDRLSDPDIPLPEIVVEQCSFFLTKDGTVISIFQHQGSTISSLLRLRVETPKTLLRDSCDASFLLHALVDAVVDHALVIPSAYEKQIGILEEMVMQRPRSAHTKALHLIGKELSLLRRMLGPARITIDFLAGKGRDSSSKFILNHGTGIYFADIADHIVSVLENLRSMEEETKELVNLIFNTISHSTNQVMKILAVVSVVFLPLTFIAGYFGQNFVNFPEIHFDLGIWYFWLWTAFTIVVTFIFFFWARLLSLDSMVRAFRRSR
ncbi:hypothetical protein SmJEL517_g02277 [Synchytrium microbalum]|uniref:Magnesium transporter n=1 Tax=Synchytrium microbalum TaxID=1806994 RepID=A0A507C2A5_9FUNG|nr:uncharacterized protein SmJEL517_g02277 [Synchytrium microbalum]TPX35257.1 hypothetical protein SmJEL517_g02277 [Synchytrium microbalum]